ncbi:ABC transporter ATP-binding protein [Streptomyces morookaense]|uniref:ABC-type quaternary amine transporter n=1 Tax=Streptomyces morookaense TaxID=1970 RepID=A0A7Y7E759_STRMO|nr:ABC transporter ATP-binding protein [Streptomyces morookaense]NVK78648.1 ABC transporter ATP-binding protein [Streptomyces morookaense]GHF44456.1 ABC transporter [Streptomyces morookaense]
MSGLSIKGLRAAHGRNEILTGVDLTVEDGALACVLGPSGCGKSTLLRVIAGFHPAAEGEVTLGGRLLDDGRRRLPAEHRRIGYVPQDGALFPHLTVAGNIGFGLPRGRRRERVAELLALVGLDGLAKRHPHELSGGQQQRVALARALATEPELLLLDEPFAALDAALRTDLRAEVAATLRRAGATAILVTHDQEEALSFADTIAVLHAGRTAQQAAPQHLYREPADTAIARFLGEANLIPATVADGKAETVFGTLPLTTARNGKGDGVVLLRPRQLRLHATPAPGAVRARVQTCRFRGHDHRVELLPADSPNGLPATLIAYTDAPWPTGEVYVEARGAVHVVEGP